MFRAFSGTFLCVRESATRTIESETRLMIDFFSQLEVQLRFRCGSIDDRLPGGPPVNASSHHLISSLTKPKSSCTFIQTSKMAPFLAQSEPLARDAGTARFAPPTLNSRSGRSTENVMASERFITPDQPSTSSTSAPLLCVELRMFKCAVVGCTLVRPMWSVTQITGGRHVEHEDDHCWKTRNLGSEPNGSATRCLICVHHVSLSRP